MDKKLNRTIGYRPNGTKAFEGKVNAKQLIDELHLPDTVEESDLLEAVNKVNNGESLSIYNGNRSVTFNPPQMSLEVRSKSIVDWIKSHPGFKWSWMCGQLEINKSNFKRLLDAEKPLFKEKTLVSIELLLKLYGY